MHGSENQYTQMPNVRLSLEAVCEYKRPLNHQLVKCVLEGLVFML